MRSTALLAIALAAVLTACRGDSSGPPPVPASVAISGVPADSGVLIGNTLALGATVNDTAGAPIAGAVVAWSSSNAAVATVDPATGLVSAHGAGQASVVAAAGAISMSVTLVVRARVSVPVVGATTPAVTTVLGGTVTVSVPPAAVADLSYLTVTTPPANATASPLAVAGTTFDFGPAGTTFLVPVTLTIRFDPSLVPVGEQNELRIYEAQGANWVEVPGGSVNVGVMLVTAPVSHFSRYAVLRRAPPASLAIVAGNGQSATAGTTVGVRPSVRVRDAAGIAVPRARVRFAVTGGGGVVIGSEFITADDAGLAVVDGWRLGPLTGANLLTASVDGIPAVPAVVFSATATAVPPPPGAAQLVIITPPAGANSGLVLATQPVVEIRDLSGSRVTTSVLPVTVAITSGTGTILGTTTVTAVNGLVTFADLRIDGNAAHTLTFTSTGLTSAQANLTVTQLPAGITMQTHPLGAVTGVPFPTQPVIRILDHAGLLIGNATLAVTATVVTGTGSLTGTTTVNASNGVVTFTNLTITGTGVHVLRFTMASPILVTETILFNVAASGGTGIRLDVTATGTAFMSGGQVLVVPILLDLSNRGPDDLASMTVTINWDPARLIFNGHVPGNWQDGVTGDPASVTASQTGSGQLTISGSVTNGAITSFTLRTLTFTAAAVGASTTTPVTAVVASPTRTGAQPIIVTSRNLTVTINP